MQICTEAGPETAFKVIDARFYELESSQGSRVISGTRNAFYQHQRPHSRNFLRRS